MWYFWTITLIKAKLAQSADLQFMILYDSTNSQKLDAKAVSINPELMNMAPVTATFL